MKLISRIFLLVAFVIGIFVATHNTQTVEFTYIPGGQLSPLPQGASLELPLFLLVLAALTVGAFFAGFASAFEHARLRAGLRKQTKVATRAAQESKAARADAEALSKELDAVRNEAQASDERAMAAETAQVGLQAKADLAAGSSFSEDADSA
jgi:uncharacterized integral membrane protein